MTAPFSLALRRRLAGRPGVPPDGRPRDAPAAVAHRGRAGRRLRRDRLADRPAVRRLQRARGRRRRAGPRLGRLRARATSRGSGVRPTASRRSRPGSAGRSTGVSAATAGRGSPSTCAAGAPSSATSGRRPSRSRAARSARTAGSPPRSAGRRPSGRSGPPSGHNPVPLIVPCHRVVRSDGLIGNYSLGGPGQQAGDPAGRGPRPRRARGARPGRDPLHRLGHDEDLLPAVVPRRAAGHRPSPGRVPLGGRGPPGRLPRLPPVPAGRRPRSPPEPARRLDPRGSGPPALRSSRRGVLQRRASAGYAADLDQLTEPNVHDEPRTRRREPARDLGRAPDALLRVGLDLHRDPGQRRVDPAVPDGRDAVPHRRDAPPRLGGRRGLADPPDDPTRRARTTDRALPTRREWRDSAIVGGLLLFGGMGMVALGEKTVPAGIAAILVALLPVWVAVLGRIFFGERLPAVAIVAASSSGWSASILLVGPFGTGGGLAFDTFGIACLLLSPICWGTGSLFSSHRAVLPRRPLTATGLQMICGGALLLDRLGPRRRARHVRRRGGHLPVLARAALPDDGRQPRRVHDLRLAPAGRAAPEDRDVCLRQPGRRVRPGRDPARRADRAADRRGRGGIIVFAVALIVTPTRLGGAGAAEAGPAEVALAADPTGALGEVARGPTGRRARRGRTGDGRAAIYARLRCPTERDPGGCQASALGEDGPATRRASAIAVSIGLTPEPGREERRVGDVEPAPRRVPPAVRPERTRPAGSQAWVRGSAPKRAVPIWWALKTAPRFGPKSNRRVRRRSARTRGLVPRGPLPPARAPDRAPVAVARSGRAAGDQLGRPGRPRDPGHRREPVAERRHADPVEPVVDPGPARPWSPGPGRSHRRG